MSIRFDERVAIVTGAGQGLGRAHALELARRGAKVVVNDLGGNLDGTGGSSEAAMKVVGEIEAMGGTAMANGASVADETGMANMVKEVMDRFGRIDILINNAGILRDKSFAKMEVGDFRAVLEVHLMGSVIATKAVWPVMKAQQYGRILMTTSSSGLYGNFGQANYGAAKLGLAGFMNTLKIEGQKDNIRVNAISPVAATRMTESLFPPAALDKFRPELVTPAVIYLVQDEAPTGEIICAGAGVFAKAIVLETTGAYLGDAPTAEDVAAKMGTITDQADAKYMFQGNEQTMKFLALAGLDLSKAS